MKPLKHTIYNTKRYHESSNEITMEYFSKQPNTINKTNSLNHHEITMKPSWKVLWSTINSNFYNRNLKKSRNHNEIPWNTLRNPHDIPWNPLEIPLFKDEKIDHLNAERQRMWELRKAAQAEAYKARECVKEEILKQRSATVEVSTVRLMILLMIPNFLVDFHVEDYEIIRYIDI